MSEPQPRFENGPQIQTRRIVISHRVRDTLRSLGAFGLAVRHCAYARMRDLTLADRYSRLLTMAFVGTATQLRDHEGDVFEGSLADALAVQYSLRLSGISAEFNEIPVTAVPLLFDSTWGAMACIRVDSEHRKRANAVIGAYRSLTLRRSRGASNLG